ncbi:MAG: hypothetical protein EZS28_014001 [Streblomastix strix]|uniref:Right handed beta helix domain-containing protein n=1 Tax=Streblomastix strix TaxID=222440 RepID=A0A5J4W6R8_9EUKA|nr:MAG: hypothetical protein EZS28_014001 [Streblomastix strix]
MGRVQLKIRVFFNQCVCSEGPGGAVTCEVAYGGLFQLKNLQFNRCRSIQGSGGAIFATIYSDGKFIIDESCLFQQCESQQSDDGGIYAIADFGSQIKYQIKDAIFQECKATNSTNPNIHHSRSGYGGALFIEGSEGYDSQWNFLDSYADLESLVNM